MEEILNSVDVVVARSGAMTITEVAKVGKPAIFIPFPYATENHQEYNARVLEKVGAAKIILDKDLKSEILDQEIHNIIKDNQTITKAELQKYVESLESDTLNGMSMVRAKAEDNNQLKLQALGDVWFNMRFVIHDGKYGVCQLVKNIYEQEKRITWGRYVTDQEEADGEYVAMVEGYDQNSWNITCEGLKNPDGTITFLGNTYKVVGATIGGSGAPYVPFLTVPDYLTICEVDIDFEKNITRAQYNDLIEKAESVLPGKLVFPELTFPDSDTITIYNNMIYVSIVLSVISVANFAMLFYFVLKKRCRRLAIMRLCGCTKFRAVMMYLGECVLIALPCYAVGILINIALTNNVFSKVFEHFAQAYSPELYLRLFVIYFSALLVVSLIMSAAAVGRSIKEGYEEAAK